VEHIGAWVLSNEIEGMHEHIQSDQEDQRGKGRGQRTAAPGKGFRRARTEQSAKYAPGNKKPRQRPVHQPGPGIVASCGEAERGDGHE